MSVQPRSEPVKLRPMVLADLPQVEALDQLSFPTPWPENAFRYELTRNPHSVCWVAELPPVGKLTRIIGSIVVWLVVDEAHIASLAVDPVFRQKGIGQRLLAKALLLCLEGGARLAMLEVREGNLAGQNLYRKFGFEAVGIRKGYYQDTHEDAILMTLSSLDYQKLAGMANPG
jgi:[ribosomal protein S18]-alanine N-acetyltransferase